MTCSLCLICRMANFHGGISLDDSSTEHVCGPCWKSVSIDARLMAAVLFPMVKVITEAGLYHGQGLGPIHN